MQTDRRYLRLLGVIAIAVVMIASVSGWPIGYVALVIFVGWPVLGTIITMDDDLPGEWDNPDGNATPEWKTMKWHVDVLCCRGALVTAAFAIQLRSEFMLVLGLAGAAFAIEAMGLAYLLPQLRSSACQSSVTTEAAAVDCLGAAHREGDCIEDI